MRQSEKNSNCSAISLVYVVGTVTVTWHCKNAANHSTCTVYTNLGPQVLRSIPYRVLFVLVNPTTWNVRSGLLCTLTLLNLAAVSLCKALLYNSIHP